MVSLSIRRPTCAARNVTHRRNEVALHLCKA
jgi:hypothetical protein